MNCQPIVGPDPIHGSFDVKYANSGTAPGSLKITSAHLSMTSASSSMDWKFSVTPTDSGSVPGGKSISTKHSKVAASGKGSEGPCGYCSGEWALNVVWTDGSTTIPVATKAAKVQCVY